MVFETIIQVLNINKKKKKVNYFVAGCDLDKAFDFH